MPAIPPRRPEPLPTRGARRGSRRYACVVMGIAFVTLLAAAVGAEHGGTGPNGIL